MESQTWNEIFVKDKKQNHSINVEELNKVTWGRMADKYIEAESLISLPITGNYQLYGYMIGKVFYVLWYDDDNGDNDVCVCGSYLRHA